MPTFFPENNEPRSQDGFLRTVQKILGAVGAGGGGGGQTQTWEALSGTTPSITLNDDYQNFTLTLAGNTTFTASGYAQGRQAMINLTGDGILRTLAFPAWSWRSAVPVELEPGDQLTIWLKCVDATEGGTIAVHVQSHLLYDAKGDILVGSGDDTFDRLGVGANNTVLVADSTQPLGVKWAAVAGTGDVVGPASATDGAPALFDSTTGKLIKNSTPTGSGNPVLQTSPTLTTPNIGTPSAGTLTNCTGLPQAGTVGLTTADSPQFTGVNVGHASDTTVGRAAAGVLALEGVAVLGGAEATVASATTTDLGAVASPLVSITGTTTITGFGTVAAGTVRQGRFTGALTLTHNGTSLILPGAANITTAAGDRFEAVSLGSGNWVVYWYQKADGTAVVGGGGTKTYAILTPANNQPPAANFATLDTRNSIAVLDFDDTTEESAIFVSVMVEAASLGSGLKIRLVWTATTATTGDCRFGVAIERMNTDIDSDSFDTAAEATTTTNATSGVPNVTEITITTIDSLAAGEPFRLKVYRDTGDAADTMAGDAELIAVEVRSAS